jgi:hypothetical protein
VFPVRYIHFDERLSIFMRDRPIFSSEDYNCRSSVEKEILAVSLKGLGAKTN